MFCITIDICSQTTDTRVEGLLAGISIITLVVGIPVLLLFLLLTGSHNLLNYAIICLVDKQTTI